MTRIVPRQRIRYVAAALTATAALALAACTASPAPTSEPTTPETGPGTSTPTEGGFDLAAIQARLETYAADPTEILQTEPVATPPTGIKVVLLNNGQGGSVRFADGVHAAADALGWDYSEIAIDAANPATLQQGFLTALTQDAQYVIQQGTAQNVIPADTVQQYRAAGAKILLASSWPFEPDDVFIGDPGDKQLQVATGKMLGDWFCADSNGEGSVLLESVTVFPVLAEYVKAFQEHTAEACPDSTNQVLEISADQIASGGIIPAVVNALRANPDIKYVSFDNIQFANGIGAALAAAGLTDIKVFGRAIDPNAVAAMKEGTVAASSGSSFFYAGYAAADIIARDLAGEDTASASINGDQPIQLVTPENVDTAVDKEGLWNLPSDALAQFAELWGVTAPPCTLGCYN